MIRVVVSGGERVTYELVQTARRSYEIRLSGEGVKVFAPRGTSLRSADQFVRERIDWLRESRAKLEAYRLRHEKAHPMAEGADILLGGQVAKIHYAAPGEKPGASEGVLTVRIKEGEEPREAVRAQLFALAREAVALRVSHYVPIMGRAPGRIAIRDQKSRWGSCSNLGNLNFNYKLVMAPPQALDYVVVHELAHLYEMNHSRRFWERVARVMPDYEDWKKWLKEHGSLLGV